MVFFSDRGVGKGPPPRPTAQKPVLGDKASAPPALSIGYGEDQPQELRSIPPDMVQARGSTFPNITPHGIAPGTGTTPFPNQRMPQLAHLPMAPPQFPFQAALPRSITSVPMPIYPNNASPMIPQTYIPAPWHGPPNVPFPVSTGYSVPLQVGHSGITPSSNQNIPPGAQYPRFPPQAMESRGPGVPFPLPNQPSVHPGQVQPPVSLQNQSLSGPNNVYFTPLVQHTQAQPGISGQLPPNQFHPGQFPQNLPNAYMGPLPPSVPSSQPQPKPRSSWNGTKQTTDFQPTPQVSFSQNGQMPLAQHSVTYSQMLPGAPVLQGMMYCQPGAAQTQVPPSSNVMAQQQTTAQNNPMFPPGNPAQNTNSSSLGLDHVPVMDKPNPGTLSGILKPSPAAPLHQNQNSLGDLLKPLSPENASAVPESKEPLQQITSQHDASSLHSQLDQLSIASKTETMRCERGAQHSTKQNNNIEHESQAGDSVMSNFDPYWTAN